MEHPVSEGCVECLYEHAMSAPLNDLLNDILNINLNESLGDMLNMRVLVL